jgi:hypothetical protein
VDAIVANAQILIRSGLSAAPTVPPKKRAARSASRL